MYGCVCVRARTRACAHAHVHVRTLSHEQSTPLYWLPSVSCRFQILISRDFFIIFSLFVTCCWLELAGINHSTSAPGTHTHTHMHTDTHRRAHRRISKPETLTRACSMVHAFTCAYPEYFLPAAESRHGVRVLADTGSRGPGSWSWLWSWPSFATR